MGSNVFGNRITNESLRDLPEYKGKTIGPRERATEALHMRSAEGKDLKARNYVESIKKDWEKYVETAKKDFEIGDKTCVLVLLYNATGDTLKFMEDYTWAGHIGRAPYPLRIENGQWGAFLHVNTLSGVEHLPNKTGQPGTSAEVTYRGRNEAGKEIDFYFKWTNWGPDRMDSQYYAACVRDTYYSTEESKASRKPVKPGFPDYSVPVQPDERDARGLNLGIMHEGLMGHAVSPIYELLVTLEHAG